MTYLVNVFRAVTHLDHVLEKPGSVVPAQEVAMLLAIHRLRRVVDAHQAGSPPGDSTVDQDRLLRESPTWTFNKAAFVASDQFSTPLDLLLRWPPW